MADDLVKYNYAVQEIREAKRHHNAVDAAVKEILQTIDQRAKKLNDPEKFCNDTLWAVIDALEKRPMGGIFWDHFYFTIHDRRYLFKKVPDCIDQDWLSETVSSLIAGLETRAEGTAKKMKAEVGL